MQFTGKKDKSGNPTVIHPILGECSYIDLRSNEDIAAEQMGASLISLGKDVDFILDGGPCAIGVESTIVDYSSGDPVILRPGGLTRERLEELLGRRVPVMGVGEVRVSGQLESHYAPRALVIIAPLHEADAKAALLRSEGRRVLLLGKQDVAAKNLYAALRRADESGAEVIVVPLPDEEGLGLAVADRLRKAAGKR